jgi:hypothetical protein
MAADAIFAFDNSIIWRGDRAIVAAGGHFR